MQPASRYTNVAIALHWIIALGIVINITLAWLWPHMLPDDAVRPAIDTHKSIGVTILGLAFLQPITGWIMDSAYKDAATHPMHYFGTFEFPRIAWIQQLQQPLKEQIHSGFGKAHEYISYVLYALLIAHIGGALKHQLLDKDPEIERMLPG